MRRKRWYAPPRRPILLVAVACLAASLAVQGHERTAPPITAADIIGMTRTVELKNVGILFEPENALIALFSPDGKRFVILLERGNSRHDTMDASIALFQTKDALSAPRPDVLLTLSGASSYFEPIRDLRWLDNDTLAFLGEKSS